MSRSGVLSAAELELVEVEVVDAPPPPVEADEESAVELLDPAAGVVTAGPLPLAKLVEAGSPPQAMVASKATAAREARIRPSV